MTSFKWDYDATEKLADGIIHVVGVALAVIGAVAVVAGGFWVAEHSDAIASTVYATCLIVTLAMSAVYNMWPVNPTKWRLRKFDHAAIYLLIAGTYTPFATRMGDDGAWLLLWIWSVAALGITLKIFLPGRFDRLAILLYLGLGWSGVALVDVMIESLSPAVVWLIVAGGVTYSAGVIFHVWHGLRFQNAIWHGFVLGGAACHYGAVYAALLTPVA